MRILIGFKRIVFAAVAAVGVIGHALGAVYVKPTACGAGDGSDWDNATTLSSGISKAMSANDTVYAAQGLYVSSGSFDTSATFGVKGGFKGESGTDETCDVDLYPTVFTQSSTVPTWEHYTVGIDADGLPEVTAEDTEQPILVNGVPTPPAAYEGLKDGYRIKTTVGAISRFIIMRGGQFTVDGVWFVGYKAQTLFYFLQGTTHVVRDCRFIGIETTGAGNPAGTISGTATLSGCQFKYIWGAACSVGYNGACTVDDCTFECCSRAGASAGGNVFSTASAFTVGNSTFAHCIDASTLEGRRGSLDKNVNTGNIYGNGLGGVAVGGTFTGCTFDGNYTVSANRYGGTPLIFGCTTLTLTDCVFTGNLNEARVWDGYGYAMIGRNFGGMNSTTYGSTLNISGTVFRGNTIRSYACTSDGGSYALGIVGNGCNPSTTTFNLTGNVFDSNVAEDGAAAEGVTAHLSRGLASVANDTGALTHTLCNNTFTGPLVEGLYDIVQYGGNQKNYVLKIQNSIFEVTDANRYDAFLLEAPQKVTLENTTVLGLTADYQDELVTYTGLETDFVPLDGTYAPTVRTPGLSTVTTKEGVSNRGAVQGVKQPEGTWSLTVRPDPVSLGTVKPTTALAVGADAVTVTAEPVEGASVTGWYDANGQQICAGDSLTVTKADLGADTVYVVKFDKAQVALTFDLGEHARFKDSGEGTRVVPSSPGRAFPAVADEEIELDDGYVMTGWLPTFPSVVPETAATYAAQIIYERDVRIVRYDSNNTSKAPKDGLTWATAFTSFKDAMDAAKQTYSEIWVKAGTHKVATAAADTFVPRDHMVIRGGYIGDDADDAARGDEPSVLEGKYAGSSKVTTMFDLSAGTCDETMVFDSVTLANAGASLINCGANAHPLITNCTFTGTARIAASGSIRILDSTFKDAQYPQNNTEIVNVTLGANATCAVERCTFDTCTVYTRSPITISGSGWLVVTDTTFTNCTSLCYYSPANIGEPNSCTIAAPNLKMSGCRIVGNLSDGGGSVMRVSNGGSVTDTLIAGNTLRRYATGSTNKGMPTTGATHFSLVPFLGALRMERCTVVSNTVDCTVPENRAEDVNNMSLFYVNAAKALLVNNTVFGNTVTTVNPFAAAGDATASIFFLTGKGMGAAVNNTFYGNVAADGELLVSAARTVTDDFGDFNNIWAAKESMLAVKKAAWTGDKLTIPVKGEKSVAYGKDVYAGADTDTSLYVDMGDGYVKLPECTSVAEPALGDPICDILGQTRPLKGSVLGSAQLRMSPGLVIILQ